MIEDVYVILGNPRAILLATAQHSETHGSGVTENGLCLQDELIQIVKPCMASHKTSNNKKYLFNSSV